MNLWRHTKYKKVLSPLPQGAQRQLKRPNTVFKAGTRYKAVYVIFSCSLVLFLPLLSFALVLVWCCVRTDGRTDGDVITKFLASMSYHNFFTQVAPLARGDKNKHGGDQAFCCYDVSPFPSPLCNHSDRNFCK